MCGKFQVILTKYVTSCRMYTDNEAKKVKSWRRWKTTKLRGFKLYSDSIICANFQQLHASKGRDTVRCLNAQTFTSNTFFLSTARKVAHDFNLLSIFSLIFSITW